MPLNRLRAAALALAAAAGLSACTTYGDYGYGYGGVSVGYGTSGYGYGYDCDPYWDDCYGGRGYHDDPWYGWYGDYYYPGIGFYIYDRGGRRHRWGDDHRRYWEGRRHHYRNRDWSDRRWERWDGFRRDGRDWRRGDGHRDWNGYRGQGRDRSERRDWREGSDNWRRGDSTGERFRTESAPRAVERSSETRRPAGRGDRVRVSED